MILSIDSGKAFDKIQNHFLIKKKPFNKVGFEWANLKIIKSIYERPIANIILTGEKLSFSSMVKNKKRMSSLTIFI